MKKIKFTPLEWEIIEHRLDAPCAIADALLYTCDENDNVVEWFDWNKTNDRASEITKDSFKWDDEHDREIILDCISGSTYCSELESQLKKGYITKGRYSVLKRAINSLYKKTGVLISVS